MYDRWYNKYLMNLYQLFKKAEKENFIKTVRLIAGKFCTELQHKVIIVHLVSSAILCSREKL